MKNRNIISTFGICKNYAGKYYLVIDGKGHHSLYFCNKAFALKKAAQYAKMIHTNFTDNEGNKTSFEFENTGEVKELLYNATNKNEEKHYIPVEMDFIINQ